MLVRIAVVLSYAVAGGATPQIWVAVRSLGAQEVSVKASILGRVVHGCAAGDKVLGSCKQGDDGENGEELHDDMIRELIDFTDEQSAW